MEGTDTPSPCDLSGNWLVTWHYATDALGQLQITHAYHFFAIAQQGDSFVVTKGLECGTDTVGIGDFAATVDTRASWPTIVSKATHTNRAGTSVLVNGACQVDFEKWYIVRGATNPYYNDPATALPSADQKATESTPGWEDWDSDGNPGITGNISGTVTGKVFMSPRMWTSLSGSVPDVTSALKLPLQWNVEQNVMSYDGSPLLASEAGRAADMTLHFAELARLTADQVPDDDQALCTGLIDLAPMLTPTASGL